MNRKSFVSDLPVYIKIGDKRHVVRIEELVYVKSEKQYVCMFFKNIEKPYKIKASLAEVASLLPKGMMISASRSYLVNINEVKCFDKNFVWVEFCRKLHLLPLTNSLFEYYFFDLFSDNPFKK